MEFIDILSCLIVGFAAGFMTSQYRFKAMISRIMDRIEEEEPDLEFVSIKLEKHGQTVFVYNRDTDAFITQVKTKEEFYKHIESNFRGKQIMMRRDDVDVLESL